MKILGNLHKEILLLEQKVSNKCESFEMTEDNIEDFFIWNSHVIETKLKF